jgi:hypothetical protein
VWIRHRDLADNDDHVADDAVVDHEHRAERHGVTALLVD